MSRSIKVSDEVYQALLDNQRPRETFSEEIARLLKMTELLKAAVPLIHQQTIRLDWQRE